MNASAIKVEYQYVGGAHFFSSKDERAQGLCVANRNLDVAFQQVGQQLKILAKVNWGEEINFDRRDTVIFCMP